MGWGSGTDVFDDVAGALLTKSGVRKSAAVSAPVCRRLLLILATALEKHDWDCQSDSMFYEHPMVQSIMLELHPDWAEEDDEDER